MNTGNYYDDFNERKKFKRVEVQFSNNLNKNFDAFEISGILQKMVTLYYKTSLVHTLANYVNYDGDLSELVVTKRTIFADTIPENEWLSLNDNVEFLCRYGLCISLGYNPRHEEFNLIFSFFSAVNEFLLGLNDQRTSLAFYKLKDYFKILDRNGVEETVETIRKDAERKIFTDDSKKHFSKYCKNKKKALGIKESYEKKDDNTEPVRPNPAADINIFFNNIIDQKLPVVAKSKDGRDGYQVLSHRHLHNNKQTDAFDVRKIFHESPTTFIIETVLPYIAGLFAAWLYYYNNLLKAVKTKVDIDKGKNDISVSKAKQAEEQLVKIQMKTIQETIDILSLIDSKYKKNVEMEVEAVEDDVIKHHLNRCLDSIQKEYIDLITSYSLSFQGVTEI